MFSLASPSLRDAGIKVAGPVRAIEHSADGMRAVLRGGKAMLFDVIYPALGCGVRSELASALGAKTNDVGCLEVDSHQRTTVDGIYAAGDVVSDLHQIAVATGHAAIAATHIHKSLPKKFKLGANGLQLGDALRDFEGIMTGLPSYDGDVSLLRSPAASTGA
jgi:thioredoxin reductase (NADPH)